MNFKDWRVCSNTSKKTYNRLRFSMVCLWGGRGSHTLDLHMFYRTLSGGSRGSSGGSLEPTSMSPIFFLKKYPMQLK